MNEKLNAAIELIKDSNKILVFTGAGISTGSGIPDFRGPKGIWKTRRPIYYQEFMKSEEARVLHWEYKLEGWDSFSKAEPNEAHYALARLEESNKLLKLVTQNIDGLHRKAGNSDEKIIEVHGTNSLIECQSCFERTDPEEHYRLFKKTHEAPLCHCGGFLKPATISFGQSLKDSDLNASYSAARDCDFIMAIGSTLSVSPANMIPLEAVKREVPYLIINQGETDHDMFAYLRFYGDIVDLIPKMIDSAINS